MADLFSLESLTTFLLLTVLEVVLGFDNILYISLESRRVVPDAQAWVRRTGTVVAIAVRVLLLFVMLELIEIFQTPFFTFDLDVISGAISGHSLIVLGGGLFLIYTAAKELSTMLTFGIHAEAKSPENPRTAASALFWIMLMNVVFSFDTVLSAIALTRNFWVMAAAIVASGVAMVVLSDWLNAFMSRNRIYEVLGMFILILVGLMLTAEGGSVGQLVFFGYPVEPMAKSTFYFAMAALLAIEITQARLLKKAREAEARKAADV